MTKRLHKGDETLRRWKIIDVSRAGAASFLPQLLARLDGDETYENRRHIVRLGKIGGSQAEARLLGLLGSETGLILGEIAQALGKLGSRQALPDLERLSGDPSEWVRQNINFALRRLR